MTTVHEKITIMATDGDRRYPNSITLTIDDTQPDCPVTFWSKGKAVFSLAAEEIPEFCRVLSLLDCTS